MDREIIAAQLAQTFCTPETDKNVESFYTAYKSFLSLISEEQEMEVEKAKAQGIVSYPI